MATNKFDEINGLKTEDDKERKIREFFEEMELPQDEIEERIKHCKNLEELFERIFILALAMNKTGEEDEEYLTGYLEQGYYDDMEEYGHDTSEPFYAERMDLVAESIVGTTFAYIADEYYTSATRAIECAENETNASENYKREQDAIKNGYTKKRWITMLDDKVRKTHMHADGQSVAIGTPFTVGDYKMMFPLDQSLGAHAKEVINCRCSVEYFDKSINKSTTLTMKTPNVSMKSNSSLITMNLTFFSTPKERVDAYGDGWQKASLSDTLQKFGVKTSHFNNMKSKIIYETNIPNVNVCYDFNGDYFTIEDITKGEQPRRYLDINAKEIPNNYTDENGKQHGLPKAEYRKITHFLNSDD